MGDFVSGARAQTMLKDFNRLRAAVRGDNWPDAQAALDKCERWFDLVSPNTVTHIEALEDRVRVLERALVQSQSILATLSRPSKEDEAVSSMYIWSNCVEAEKAARAALQEE